MEGEAAAPPNELPSDIMVTESTVPPTPPTHSVPFPFFALPAELRDWVYDCLNTDEYAFKAKPATAAVQSSIKAYMHDRLMLDCLLVSRNFSREYRDRRAKLQKLVFKDQDYFNNCCIPQLAPPFPDALSHVRRCEMVLVAFEGGSDLLDHPRWIADALVHMPQTQGVDITTYLQLTYHKTTMERYSVTHQSSREALERICNIKHVRSMRLFAANDKGAQYQNLDQVIASETRLLGTWRRDLGWEHAVVEEVKTETDSEDEE